MRHHRVEYAEQIEVDHAKLHTLRLDIIRAAFWLRLSPTISSVPAPATTIRARIGRRPTSSCKNSLTSSGACMPCDSFKRSRSFGWLHLAVGITMGLDELKSR